MGYALSQRWIEAGTTLLDECKVESRGVGDRLDVIRGHEVRIGSRNRGKLPSSQTRNGRGKLESGIEIRIFGPAAVARIPASVYGKLHEVREPLNLVRPSRFAARQCAELVQINFFCALELQVGVDKRSVAELVFRIVVDVLGHVTVQLLEGHRIGLISTGRKPREFVVRLTIGLGL